MLSSILSQAFKSLRIVVGMLQRWYHRVLSFRPIGAILTRADDIWKEGVNKDFAAYCKIDLY